MRNNKLIFNDNLLFFFNIFCFPNQQIHTVTGWQKCQEKIHRQLKSTKRLTILLHHSIMLPCVEISYQKDRF